MLQEAKSLCDSVEPDMFIVVSAVMVDKPVTQQTLLIKLLREAIERLKIYNYPTRRSYELQRFVLYIKHISLKCIGRNAVEH